MHLVSFEVEVSYFYSHFQSVSFLHSLLLSVQLEAYMEILSLDYCTSGVSGLFGHEFCYCMVLGCGGNRPTHLHLCVH